MENRITRLLMPILIGIAAFFVVQQLFLPKPPPKQGGVEPGVRKVEETEWIGLKGAIDPGAGGAALLKQTGEPGDVGLRVELHNYGGTLARAWLLDAWNRPKLSAAERADPASLYQVLDYEPHDYSFRIDDYHAKLPLRDPFAKPSEPGWVRVGDVCWQLAKDTADEVVYRLELDNGLVIENVYRFFKGVHSFRFLVRLRNVGAKVDHLGGYWKYRLIAGSALSNPKSEWGMFNSALCFARSTDGRLGRRAPDGSPIPGDQDVLRRIGPETIEFAGTSSRFFACILRPVTEETAKSIEAVKAHALPQHAGVVADTKPWTNLAAMLEIVQRIPASRAEGEAISEVEFDVYLGPKDRDFLASRPEYRPYLEALDRDFDPGCFCAVGATQMAKVLLWVLKLFEGLLGNWGLAIILLTIVVRAALMPINFRQAKTMRAYQQRMAKVKPEMDKLKEKHKNDAQKLNQAMLKLQREHKIFPPLMGCLPMFLTMPILFGLFSMLRASFELRHQPFLLWIQDLSQPDRLFRIGDLSQVPLLPDFSYFNLLPVVMTTLWVVNMLRQPLPEEPQARTQFKMMRVLMPLMGLMLYNYASGLALYMTVSAVWTLIEQSILKKKLGAAPLPTM